MHLDSVHFLLDHHLDFIEMLEGSYVMMTFVGAVSEHSQVFLDELRDNLACDVLARPAIVKYNRFEDMYPHADRVFLQHRFFFKVDNASGSVDLSDTVVNRNRTT